MDSRFLAVFARLMAGVGRVVVLAHAQHDRALIETVYQLIILFCHVVEAIEKAQHHTDLL